MEATDYRSCVVGRQEMRVGERFHSALGRSCFEWNLFDCCTRDYEIHIQEKNECPQLKRSLALSSHQAVALNTHLPLKIMIGETKEEAC